MRVTLILIGVIFCMTEASSARWAKNHVKAFLNSHHTNVHPATTFRKPTTGTLNK